MKTIKASIPYIIILIAIIWFFLGIFRVIPSPTPDDPADLRAPLEVDLNID